MSSVTAPNASPNTRMESSPLRDGLCSPFPPDRQTRKGSGRNIMKCMSLSLPSKFRNPGCFGRLSPEEKHRYPSAIR
ncbi:MAG: hypothetical protein MJY43_01365 [Bacteroidales bacterium]|nr:hypothetical protein [Bacteroidales bacterium]